MDELRRRSEERQARGIAGGFNPLEPTPRNFNPLEREPEPQPERLEFGAFPGSGVLENLAGGGLQALERIRPLGEAGAGVILNTAATVIPNPLEPRTVRRFREEQEREVEASRERGETFGRFQAAAGRPFVSIRESGDIPGAAATALEIAGDPLNLIPVGAGINLGRRVLGGGLRAAGRTSTAIMPRRGVQFLEHASDNEIVSRVDRLRSLNEPGTVASQFDKGPLGWVKERVGGLGAVVNRNDALGKSFVLFKAREEQAPSLIARTVSEFAERSRGLFQTNDLGEVLNVGVAPGTQLRTGPGRGALPDQFALPQAALPSGGVVAPPAGPRVALQLSQVIEDAFEGGMDALPNGMFRNRNFGYTFTREQVEFIEDYHRVVSQAGDWLRRTGVDLREVMLEGAESVYTPRRVIRSMRREQGRFRGGRLPDKEGFERARVYIGQQVAESIAEGIVYESDPVRLMADFLAGVYRAGRTQQLSNALVSGGVTRFTRQQAATLITLARAAGRRALKPEELDLARQTNRTISDYIEAVGNAEKGFDKSLQSRELVGKIRGAVGEQLQEIGGAPLLKGQMFSPDTAKRIQSQVTGPGRLVRGITDVGDLARTATTTLDLGNPLIQGIPLLAKDPVKWAAGWGGMLKSLIDRDTLARYIRRNADLYREMPFLNVGTSTEWFTSLERGGLLERGLRRIPVAGEPALKVFRRFAEAFSYYGTYARTELAKAYKPMLDDAARRGNTRALNEAQDALNKMTGVLSPGSLVIGPKQEMFERGFMFFAPRYTRAILGAVYHAFTPGVEGHITRDLLVRMAAGGSAAYYMFAHALGQEPQLDPTKAGFMSIKIGDDVVGVGSAWVSLVRLIGNIVADPAILGEGGVADSELLFQSREPGRSWPEKVGDNPLVRWVRSRSSVPTGLAWDIASGHDYIGNPIEGVLSADVAKHIGSHLLPFALEGALMGRPHRSGPAAATAEFFGLRGYPLPLSQRRNLMRDQAALAAHGRKWDGLNRLQRAQLEAQDQELAVLTEQARRDRVVRGREIDALVDGFFTEREAIQERWNAEVESGIRRAELGVIGLKELRERVIASANSARRDSLDQVEAEDRFAPVREWFDTLPKLPGRSEEKPEDVAYNEYISLILTNPDLEDPEGFNFTLQRELIEQWREKWGDAVHGYVLARLEHGDDLPPLVEELIKGRQQHAYFWGGVREEGSVMEQIVSRRNDSALVRALVEQWEETPEQRRREFEALHPQLRSVLRMRSRVRSALRERNPELDVFLLRWGYTDTLVAQENQFDGARDDALAVVR
jgi:hypothetical protein